MLAVVSSDLVTVLAVLVVAGGIGGGDIVLLVLRVVGMVE